jgi:hypothetical protein
MRIPGTPSAAGLTPGLAGAACGEHIGNDERVATEPANGWSLDRQPTFARRHGGLRPVGTTGDLDGNLNFGDSDVFITQFTSLGVKTWTRQFGTSALDEARGIALTSAGEIYVSGSTYGTFTSAANGGGGDFFLTRWAEDGSVAWTAQSATSDLDSHGAIGADSTNGAICVLGAVGKSNPIYSQGVILKVAAQ